MLPLPSDNCVATTSKALAFTNIIEHEPNMKTNTVRAQSVNCPHVVAAARRCGYDRVYLGAGKIG